MEKYNNQLLNPPFLPRKKYIRSLTISSDLFYELFEVKETNQGDTLGTEAVYIDIEIKEKDYNQKYQESTSELLEQGMDPDDIPDNIDENGLVIR